MPIPTVVHLRLRPMPRRRLSILCRNGARSKTRRLWQKAGRRAAPVETGSFRRDARGRFWADPELLGIDDEFFAVISSGEGAEPQRLRQAGLGAMNAQLAFGGDTEVAGLRSGDLETYLLPSGRYKRREFGNIEHIEAGHVSSSFRSTHAAVFMRC